MIGRIFNAIFNVHPMHSMTVHFPIAFFAAAFLFLLLALWRRNEVFERVSFYNFILATLGTLVAGITGVRDNLIRYEGEAQFANVKIFLAITLFLLALGTLFARWRRPDLPWKGRTMVLYVAAFGLTAFISVVLAFFGGVILYGF